MRRFLLLGNAQLHITWLEIDSKGHHTTHRDAIPVKIYKEMPYGYVGPAKGYTVNAEFMAFQMDVEPGTWLTIVPEEKVPPNLLTITL